QPVVAAAHLTEPRLLRFKPAVPAGTHREEMFESDASLSRIEIGDGALRKPANQRLLHVWQMALVNRQPYERRRDALCDRSHVMARLLAKGIKISVHGQSPVSNYLHTMNGHRVRSDKVQHLDEGS